MCKLHWMTKPVLPGSNKQQTSMEAMGRILQVPSASHSSTETTDTNDDTQIDPSKMNVGNSSLAEMVISF